MAGPNFSAVALGVADIDSAGEFFSQLGWNALTPDHPEEGRIFSLGACNLELMQHDSLAAEAGWQIIRGHNPDTIFTLSVAKAQDVAILLERARAAGATILKPAERHSSGMTSGCFIEPDGHIFKVTCPSGS